ncbi:MAG: zf-TFIIB domain-containing protein [Candidatus Lernaella stagnicola]|nr:zf-TFIIB domain-containing protein [Candidatus Lernaella stagnicola]
MADLRNRSVQSEQEYFARIEFERRKKLLDEEHARMQQVERENLKKKHWMRCPKCGMEMVELEFETVKIDKCTECGGIYLDDGELSQLLQKKNEGFLNRFTKMFKK